jgi:hypothetical protein
MARYDVTLKDRTIEVIDGADAYQQEGQMTTFFAVAEDRRVVDCWSSRLASFRTSEILSIRRRPPEVESAWTIDEPAAHRLHLTGS